MNGQKSQRIITERTLLIEKVKLHVLPPPLPIIWSAQKPITDRTITVLKRPRKKRNER